jgi:hypothetical protein
MSWDDLKKLIDAKISASGLDGSVLVEYIKVARHGAYDLQIVIPEIERGAEAGLQVWND